MNRRDFLSGRWGPYLERALVIKPTFNGSLNGGMVGDFAYTSLTVYFVFFDEPMEYYCHIELIKLHIFILCSSKHCCGRSRSQQLCWRKLLGVKLTQINQ